MSRPRWPPRGELTAAQSGALFVLGQKDGALIGEAAEALDLAPSAMTGLVDRMVRAELVERRPDPKDGRAFRLHPDAPTARPPARKPRPGSKA